MESHVRSNVFEIFPTMVTTHDLSTDPSFNVMRDVVNKTKTSEHALMKNAESTYNESTGNAWLDHMLLKDFKNLIQQCIDQYTQTYGLKQLRISNSWMNRIGLQGAVRPHRHEMSALSGAFYPQAEPGSTPLILKNPTNSHKMYEIHTNETFFNAGQIEMECIVGQLILFPSWLEHYTEDNDTENRVTVSFNTSYV